MIPDLVLALLFLGLVALVAWALNKRSNVLSQKPMDNIVPVFESPIVMPVESLEPVEVQEAPQDVLPVEAVAVEQPKPKNKGGRPKKAVTPAEAAVVTAVKAPRRKKTTTPDTAA